jgi:hypothetical protein
MASLSSTETPLIINNQLIMFTFPKSKMVSITTLTLTAAAFFVSWQLLSVPVAEAQTPGESTYQFSLTKKFSGPYPAELTAAQFKFHIEGTSATGTVVNQTVDLIHDTDDTANVNVNLPIGTYTVTEIGPISFVPDEWTVQWSGYGCQNANSPTLFTTMTVSDDVTGNVCRADNQWRHGKLTVEKIIIGTSSSPVNFDFAVTQGSNVRYDGPFNEDGTNTDIPIAIGDYEVTEDVYPDYTTTYRINDTYSDDGCTGTMSQGGSVTCTITNTYTGENGGGGDDGNGDDDQTTCTGTLVVKKEIVGTTTVSASDFSFSYTGATGSTTFAASGTNHIEVATGTYTVIETTATGYVTTYNNCTDIIVAANATSTCTITNTLDTGNNGGDDGNGGDDDYRLQGYVWHDTNKDGVWDENENPLPDWTVHLTNGSSSRSTTTDTNGYYSFTVDEGVWTLSETVKTDWSQTHPIPVSYNVTVPEEQLTLIFPLKYLFSIAHAETISVNGDFNFGNVFEGGRGGGGDNDEDGNGSATRTERNGNGGSATDSAGNTPEPTPMVLGEQVSVVPRGGANAGAGGTATQQTPFAFLLITTVIFAVAFVTGRKLSQ